MRRERPHSLFLRGFQPRQGIMESKPDKLVQRRFRHVGATSWLAVDQQSATPTNGTPHGCYHSFGQHLVQLSLSAESARVCDGYSVSFSSFFPGAAHAWPIPLTAC